MFFKDGFWNSELVEVCLGESWLDSLLGDLESFSRVDTVISKESFSGCKSYEFERGFSFEFSFFTEGDFMMRDFFEKSVLLVKF